MSGQVEEFIGMFERPLGKNLFYHVVTDTERLWILPKGLMKDNEHLAGKKVKLTGVWLDEVVISPRIIRPITVVLVEEESEQVARTFKGRVAKSSLSGGNAWMLTTQDGIKYELAGGPIGILTEGDSVEISGNVDTKAMGITMAGSILRPETITVLSGSEKRNNPPFGGIKVDGNGIAEVNNEDAVY